MTICGVMCEAYILEQAPGRTCGHMEKETHTDRFSGIVTPRGIYTGAVLEELFSAPHWSTRRV